MAQNGCLVVVVVGVEDVFEHFRGFLLGEQISKGELWMRSSLYIMFVSSGGRAIKGDCGLTSG